MKNILKYGFGAIGSALISLITIPFLTRIMSPEDFGKGGTFIVLMSLCYYLINCGMDQVYERYYFDDNFKENRTKLFLSLLAIALIFLCIFFIPFVLALPYISEFFFSSGSKALYLLILIGIVGFLLNKFGFISLRMQKKSGAYMLGQIGMPLIYLLSIIVSYFLFNLKSFYIILIGQVISYWVIFLWFLFIDKYSWSVRHFRKNIDLRYFREFIQYGWPFIFTYSLAWGFQSIDRVLLISLGSYDELGIYSASFTLIAPLVLVQGVFSTVWSPVMNKLILHHRFKASYILNKLLHLMLTLMTLGALVIICFSPILHLLLGDEYFQSIKVFGCLLFIPVFYVMADIVIAGIVLAKNSRLNMLTTLLSLIINIVLCLILIPLYGALGAAISISASYGMLFVVRWWLADRYIKLSPSWIYISFLILSLVIAQFVNFLGLILLILLVISLAFTFKIYKKNTLIMRYLR
ncbi:oligosaccharide flippase family protein [Francisellaceae bacterium]|nr:oligosaccharide flippase family protein [Francisellaceae bacterium]